MAATGSAGVKCPICGVVLSNEMELGEHMETHEEKRAEGQADLSPHKCAFCGARFKTPEELRDHHRTAHNK